MLDSHSQQVTAGRLQLGGLPGWGRREGGRHVLSVHASGAILPIVLRVQRSPLPTRCTRSLARCLFAAHLSFFGTVEFEWVGATDPSKIGVPKSACAMTVLGGVIGQRSSEPGGADAGLGFRRSLMRRLGLVGGAAKGEDVADGCRLSKWSRHGFDSPTPNPRYLNCFPNKNSLLRLDSTQAGRDLWLTKLTDVISAEREKEPRTTNIQVVYYDLATNIEYVSRMFNFQFTLYNQFPYRPSFHKKYIIFFC